MATFSTVTTCVAIAGAPDWKTSIYQTKDLNTFGIDHHYIIDINGDIFLRESDSKGQIHRVYLTFFDGEIKLISHSPSEFFLWGDFTKWTEYILTFENGRLLSSRYHRHLQRV